VTESEDQKVDFREADRRYAEIKRRHEAGTLSDKEFDEQLKQLMVQDKEGRWWVKSRTTGEWHYHDGIAWKKDTPPGYEGLESPAISQGWREVARPSPSISQGWKESLSGWSLFVLLLIVIAIFILVLLLLILVA
jgi:hypothetical protein